MTDTKKPKPTSIGDTDDLSMEECNLILQKYPNLKDLAPYIPKPVFFDSTIVRSLTDEEAAQGLQTRTLHLPLFTSTHENRLLQQAGPFLTDNKWITFPPCKNNLQCVTVIHPLPGTPSSSPNPIIMMKILTEVEYEYLLQTGISPTESRPCILCVRYGLTALLAGVIRPHPEVKVPTDRILQCYRNLVNEPEGYNIDMMIVPRSDRFEGLVDPVATFKVSYLRLRKTATNDRYYVDQTAMMYHAPTSTSTLNEENEECSNSNNTQQPQQYLYHMDTHISSMCLDAEVGEQLYAYMKRVKIHMNLLCTFMRRELIVLPSSSSNNENGKGGGQQRGQQSRFHASSKYKKAIHSRPMNPGYQPHMPPYMIFNTKVQSHATLKQLLLHCVCSQHAGTRDILHLPYFNVWKHFLRTHEDALTYANLRLFICHWYTKSYTTKGVDPDHRLVTHLMLDRCLFAGYLYEDDTNRQNDWKAVVELSSHLTLIPFHTFLPQFSSVLYKCCFWSNIRSATNSLIHLLCKCIPQRCQTRRFAAALESIFKTQPVLISVVIQWLFCAVLGNYPWMVSHDRWTSSSVNERRHIIYLWYRLCSMKSSLQRCTEFLLSIPHSVAFAIRCYIIHCIQDEPGLGAGLDSLFDLQAFKDITLLALIEIRTFIRSYKKDWISDHFLHFLQITTLTETLERTIHRHHNEMLSIAYQRKMDNVFSLFKTVFMNTPACEKLATLDESILRYCHRIGLEILYRLHHTFRACPCYSSPASASTSTTVIHNSIVQDVLQRIVGVHSIKHDFYSTIITQTSSENGQQQQQQQQQQQRSKRSVKSQFRTQCKEHPVKASRFFIFCLMWFNHENTRLYPLPEHYAENQSDAVYSAYQKIQAINPTTWLTTCPVELSEFVFCSDCGAIHSVLCEWSSMYRREYDYGHRKGRIDYTTLTSYCGKIHTVPVNPAERYRKYISACFSSPATRLNLEGKILLFERKLITICPQPGCGRTMVLDFDRALYTQYGYACRKCTVAYYDTKIEKASEQSRDLINEFACRRNCDLCGRDHLSAHRLYIYPFHTLVCQRHHSSSLMEFARRLLREDGLTNQDVFLHQMYKFTRVIQPKTNMINNKKALQLSKQKIRSKRA